MRRWKPKSTPISLTVTRDVELDAARLMIVRLPEQERYEARLVAAKAYRAEWDAVNPYAEGSVSDAAWKLGRFQRQRDERRG